MLRIFSTVYRFTQQNWPPVIGLALRRNQSGAVHIGHSSLFKIMSNPTPENTAGMDAAITSLIGTQRIHSMWMFATIITLSRITMNPFFSTHKNAPS